MAHAFNIGEQGPSCDVTSAPPLVVPTSKFLLENLAIWVNSAFLLALADSKIYCRLPAARPNRFSCVTDTLSLVTPVSRTQLLTLIIDLLQIAPRKCSPLFAHIHCWKLSELWREECSLSCVATRSMHAFQGNGLFHLHCEVCFLLPAPICEGHPKQSPKIRSERTSIHTESIPTMTVSELLPFFLE